ncbi:MAG: hypothetical protein ABI618_04960, partial [Nitrospirota bacterium]
DHQPGFEPDITFSTPCSLPIWEKQPYSGTFHQKPHGKIMRAYPYRGWKVFEILNGSLLKKNRLNLTTHVCVLCTEALMGRKSVTITIV